MDQNHRAGFMVEYRDFGGLDRRGGVGVALSTERTDSAPLRMPPETYRALLNVTAQGNMQLSLRSSILVSVAWP